ncbi:hypothetical protein TTHERM_00146270 (macronuclear) [Tetrahymena thermophila SB210]|uniref:Uncharacterized protein n=1 Tax=Tetrahymena thermophila (strain SB210) TaxID=312017 RepID=I7MI97_TETTS|nr:hypothetical protein TTHERM_00146270 [Tetrahymena thermophila SB210]EAR91021.1 hypothetical protein TTHERM_00146270 [Tetrahymena thermophila SB210]|eukprot:XP_001011266.1 hypothetical protein TTHERM_00146270 [Tetrahymena thermophila SB210]
MNKISIVEQLLSHQDYTLDNNSTNCTQASFEDDNNSPLIPFQRVHFQQKYELPKCIDQIEAKINDWLDQNGIFMANPAEKEEKFYENKRNNIWANFRSSNSCNNLGSMTQIGSQPLDNESCLSSPSRSPELRLLPKLNSICDLNSEQELSLNSRKNSDSLFERRKGRMKTMLVQGSPVIKPSIYSQSKTQSQES